MQPIVPAVIPHSAAHLADTLARIAFARHIQIDLVDGVFAYPPSWPYEPLGAVDDAKESISQFSIEVDLMVENYIEAAYQWHLIGAQRFTFHSETIRDIKEIVAFKSECSCEVGIAANNDSPLTALTKHIEHFDFVQVMGIATIGAQGSKFDNRALVRVLEIKAAFPDAVVQIDGSVNESTLPQLRDAGADRFVVGSAILNAENPEGMYRTLDKLAKEMQ